MSYDYNAILQSITKNRTKAYENCSATSSYPSLISPTISNIDVEALSEAVEGYATLSSHCPLPPLLWLQYACDAGVLMEGLLSSGEEDDDDGDIDMNDIDMAEKQKNRKQVSETRIGILAAGIEEFPGSKLLRRWYLEELMRDYENFWDSTGTNEKQEMKMLKAFTEAVEWVCEGSYYYDSTEDDNDGESCDILTIWKLFLMFLSKSTSPSKIERIKECFLHRSSIPAKHINDELRDEISTIPEIANDASFLEAIEDGRRNACKLDSEMAPFEDEIIEAMSHEGIYKSSIINDDLWVYGGNIFLRLQKPNSNENGDSPIPHQNYLMGLGGQATANVFIKFAISKATPTTNPKHIQSYVDSVEKTKKDMLLSLRIFERAISECPTVEQLWISYIHFLLRISQSHPTFLAPSILLDACHRSVRNCPYSATLYKLQMHCRTLDLKTEIDLDGLLEISKAATEAKLLPSSEAYLDVHLEVPRVIRRRLLKVLSSLSSSEEDDDERGIVVPFDISDSDVTKEVTSKYIEKLPPMDDIDKIELIHDLIDDIREAYKSADLFVRKNYHNWNLGRGKLWRERATMEAHLFYPICASYPPDLDGDDEDGGGRKRRKKKSDVEKALEGKLEEEAVKCFEKLVRIHPKCVEAWREYIAFMMSIGATNPVSSKSDEELECGFVVDNLRKVRGLYRRAIKVAGTVQSGESSIGAEFALNDDQNSSLSSFLVSLPGMVLCQEFLTFERNFGSLTSIKNAVNLIRPVLKKIEDQSKNSVSIDFTKESEAEAAVNKKRTASEMNSIENEGKIQKDSSESKRIKIDHIPDEVEKADSSSQGETEAAKPTNLKVLKQSALHITIGKMTYPAHPYTIHVTNLSPETQDMDLVDTFKQCGGIVHARVLRVKSHNPKEKAKSKGSGLVQFEEQTSVESALELSENIGLHERLIKVERSHCAAVPIVSPGMHRVNPKGEGKRSKFNSKMKIKKETSKADNNNTQNEQNTDKRKDESGARDVSTDKTASKEEKETNKKSSKSEGGGSLLFQPRGLTNRNIQKKKRMNI